MSFKEFASRETMLEYEKEREQYYMDGISICNRRHIFAFYKTLFLETFHPKYRAIKKEYDGYCGGWWRNDKDGRAQNIFNILIQISYVTVQYV